ncbi:GntR family transcriptional regulator [Yimella sp. cx-573]|uniref:GntR family transcriptional regulator n=1 Tax=Yimella sp. cx-51 TaxID=2770551 RepID=UPI00296F38A3
MPRRPARRPTRGDTARVHACLRALPVPHPHRLLNALPRPTLDLPRRIASGEFGEAGDRIPTLADLMAAYRFAGVQTMRAAQAVLVDEGVLETRHGSGAFIVRVPSADTVGVVAIGDELEQLHEAVARVRQHVTALRDRATSPAPEPATAGRLWEWASWTHCATCDSGTGGTTRGWANDIDEYDRLEYCREQGHDYSSGVGLLPEQDPETAAAIESWWEHHAHTEEAARLVLAGDINTARWHAQRAHDLANHYDDFAGFSSPVSPPVLHRPWTG